MMKSGIFFAAALGLTACMQSSGQSLDDRTPPSVYDSLSCGPIERATQEIARRIRMVDGVEDEATTGQLATPGEPVVLFLPPIAFQNEPDARTSERAYLMQEQAAVRAASEANTCELYPVKG